MHDSDDPHDASRVDPDEAAERLQLLFLAEAPKLPGAEDLGAATAAVTPWPHQLRVVRRAVASYPQSFLFADEVGLGKTLEAGLALRQLWISGRARRVLILVPRAVLRQWQEELREKLGLDVPRLDGRQVLDVFDREVDGDPKVEPGASVWDRYPLLLASSQTARSKRRRDALLAARRWDLVIVDEAHHARRRQARLDTFRPNRLLELLAGPAAHDGERVERRGLVHRTRCLYLLTATPMQVHPVEVWDLLRLLGLGGRWGARPDTFVAFFEELRKPAPGRDWRFLLTLLADAFELHETWGGTLEWPAALGPIVEPVLEGDLDAAVERVRAMDAEILDRLDRLLRSANPVHVLVFRHTRERLRHYRRQGRLAIDVPEREPENVWIELSAEERALYRRIEAYLSRFYQRYEAKRTGLGFVMTVYRRRLTSSFAAVRRSLERRRAWLVGQGSPGGLLGADDRMDDDPGDQADLFASLEASLEGESAVDRAGPTSRDELEHLDAFLEALAALDGDSKLDRLVADLGVLLAERDRILVFTQYTDTMDHLRDRLRQHVDPPVAGHAIACYSGRGGERWDGTAWTPWDKESLKTAFGDGAIRVLLCTEAASEGLNLQTCGVLVNYDMPWNPMRVEQRIGRVDRIGQRHPTVWIRNYFYADTVEATIYQRLTDRIDWFRAVVGELQPILHRVGEALQSLALVPEARRTKPLEETLASLHRSLDEAPADPIADPTDEVGGEVWNDTLASVPALPEEVEALIVGSARWGDRFTPADASGVYHLDDGIERAVTFRPERYAERPYSLDLLAWGTPRFDALLAEVEPPPMSDDPAGIGLYQSSNPAPVSLFVAPGSDGVEALTDLSALRRCLALPIPPWRPSTEGDASSTFSQRRTRALRETTRVEAGRRRTERRALLAEAADVVRTAATVDLLKAEHPGLFDQPLGFGWGRDAIRAQRRHGRPFDQIVDRLPDDLGVSRDESAVLALRGRSHRDLDRAFVAAEARGVALVERWAALDRAEALERQALREPSAGGLLDRTFFLVHPENAAHGPPTLDPVAIEPFVDAVPIFDDLAALVRDLAEARDEGRDLLTDAARNPAAVEWVAHAAYGRATVDRFAAPLPHDAFGLPAATVAVFRLETAIPRQGTPVIVLHAGQVDLGAWQLDDIWEDGALEGRRVRLITDDGSIEIEDPEAIRLIASWVETLG